MKGMLRRNGAFSIAVGLLLTFVVGARAAGPPIIKQVAPQYHFRPKVYIPSSFFARPEALPTTAPDSMQPAAGHPGFFQ